jgi:excinuclease ABC subunit A
VEARYVKVGSGKQRAIYEVAATPLRETLSFFET